MASMVLELMTLIFEIWPAGSWPAGMVWLVALPGSDATWESLTSTLMLTAGFEPGGLVQAKSRPPAPFSVQVRLPTGASQVGWTCQSSKVTLRGLQPVCDVTARPSCTLVGAPGPQSWR